APRAALPFPNGFFTRPVTKSQLLARRHVTTIPTGSDLSPFFPYAREPPWQPSGDEQTPNERAGATLRSAALGSPRCTCRDRGTSPLAMTAKPRPHEGAPLRRAVITLTAFLGGLIFLLASGSTTAWAEGEGLKGRLVHQGQPVNGVKISVADESGAHVGEATTDAQGEWAVPVPEAGTYKVSIDQSSLPQGVALRDPNRATLTVQVYEGNQRNVLFALVAAGQQQQQQGENAPPSEAEQYWSRVAQLAFEGLSLGLTIALGAVGLSLIFGTTGLTNFSHGELLTIGAFTAYLFNTAFGLHLLIAAPLAVLVAAAFG